MNDQQLNRILNIVGSAVCIPFLLWIDAIISPLSVFTYIAYAAIAILLICLFYSIFTLKQKFNMLLPFMLAFSVVIIDLCYIFCLGFEPIVEKMIERYSFLF